MIKHFLSREPGAVSKEKMMRKKIFKNRKKAGVGKVVTGILVGGVIGATVGWLTAPASGAETRRRLLGEEMSAGESAKTAENIESQARELVGEVRYHTNASQRGPSSSVSG